MKKQKPVSRLIGNLLVLLSLGGFVFIYFPYFSLLFSAPTLNYNYLSESGFLIFIPRLGITAPITREVDPWDETIYRSALDKGVAHASGSALPGEGRSIFLFAHSSEMPWRMTRQNTAFLRLGELNPGDTIELRYQGQLYQYEVTLKKEVWPAEVSALVNFAPTEELILQTCTPVGTAFKRLLVFATPKTK